MSEDLKQTQRQIALAQMADQFLKGELGQFCIEMAEFQKDSAFEQLALVDPTDAKEISRLQNIIVRHDDFSQWLLDLITVGDLAYEEYTLMDAEQ